MRVLILFLIIPLMNPALSACAAEAGTGDGAGDEARPARVEVQPAQSQSERVARPARKAVKMSPTIRVVPRSQDQDGKMRRIAPPSGESPLLNMPAPKDMSSPQGNETPGSR